jgi:predicted metal-dependent peptidase
MEELSDKELEFVLMHEILHVVLRHCARGKNYDPFLFNIACDIVVNSNIMHSNCDDKTSITLKKYGESMHLTPSGEEGYKFTAEEVYEQLLQQQKKAQKKSGEGKEGGGASGKSKGANGDGKSVAGGFDDHTKWKGEERDEERDLWEKRLRDACEAVEIRQACTGRGTLPMGAERKLKELRRAQTDWRQVLSEFVQEEICDYSFSPPDRRFDESPFYLPDFNEKDESISKILFMIDTSGSMSDDMVTAAYSEVRGAIEQFGGKLQGWLGFFDAEVIPPKPFETEDEFKVIKAKGGGGTDFGVIFKYIEEKMSEEPPVSIIVLTDGYAPFPKKTQAQGIPVLWLLNNEDINPPWGKVARIEVK